MISREPIFRIHCELANILDVGPAPFGHRRVVNILGGTVAGEKLSGRILPGGADWQILAADGAADIHARYTIESDAGALIQVDSKGLRHGPPDVLARLAKGEDVDPVALLFPHRDAVRDRASVCDLAQSHPRAGARGAGEERGAARRLRGLVAILTLLA